MKPPLHPDSLARVNALHSYEILDTPREQEFDQIVELVARVCDAPICVINLIDEERQWFKAETGLGVRETPLETSICAHIILGEDFVEIPDTLADPRMCDNPLCVDEPHLRFYAGALLKTSDGLPLGTLCVLDHEPRRLTPLQADTVRIIARQVMTQLDLRRALKQRDVLRAEIDHRVKNSLQTVASMVNLQAREAGAEESAAVTAITRRIESISLLHAELNRTDTHDSVALDRYMRQIGDLLTRSAPGNIGVIVDIPHLFVTSSLASSLALIANEFVANSIKHGFDETGGDVRIHGMLQPSGDFRFRLEDNGTGPGDATDTSETGGLGLKIMQSAAMQLGGMLDRVSTPRGYALETTIPADRLVPQSQLSEG